MVHYSVSDTQQTDAHTDITTGCAESVTVGEFLECCTQKLHRTDNDMQENAVAYGRLRRECADKYDGDDKQRESV